MAAPALAAPPSRPELAEWLSRNTDVPAAQVAIVAPEDVYSLQPLGPSLPDGEVIALVRTEVLAADWGAAHGFQSWEAHLMFDCRAGRVRILKSTVYPEPNRKGAAKVESAGGDWFAPKPSEPAAQLLAAACDASFVWPLRSQLAAKAPDAGPKIVVEAPPTQPKSETPPMLTVSAAAASPAPTPRTDQAGKYAVQIVYTSSEAGARHALAQARAKLGPIAAGLSDVMQRSEFGRHKRLRLTGYLSGFGDAASAQAACEALLKAKQDCVARLAPSEPAGSAVPTTIAAEPQAGTYFVQVARGPSEAAAKKALAQARATLGPLAESLTDATDEARLGQRRRYTARLMGFATAEAAGEACSKLASAGQACFARPQGPQP
jgi:hypothetical protein